MMVEDTSFDNDMNLANHHDDEASHMHEVLGLGQSVCCYGMEDTSNDTACPSLPGPLLTRFATALKNRLSPQLKIAPEMPASGTQSRSNASETHTGLSLIEVQQ